MRSLILVSSLLLIPQAGLSANLMFKVERCQLNAAYDMPCSTVIKKTVSPHFPIVDGGDLKADTLNKSLLADEKIDGLEFVLASWAPRKGIHKEVPSNQPLSVISVQVMDKNNKQLHFSESSFFPDKTSNFLSMPLVTNSTQFRYRAEVRQID